MNSIKKGSLGKKGYWILCASLYCWRCWVNSPTQCIIYNRQLRRARWIWGKYKRSIRSRSQMLTDRHNGTEKADKSEGTLTWNHRDISLGVYHIINNSHCVTGLVTLIYRTKKGSSRSLGNCRLVSLILLSCWDGRVSLQRLPLTYTYRVHYKTPSVQTVGMGSPKENSA